MKYISEFRDSTKVQGLLEHIHQQINPNRQYRIMEFCGGHTHTIFKFGLQNLLPKNFKFIHGPGCPVCVLPISRIEIALQIAQQKDVILCSFGDMLRIPGANKNSLLRLKAQGFDIRMVYSALDALDIAKKKPNKKIVFFAIGFETTSPGTAITLKLALAEKLQNFFVFCNHILAPPAAQHLLEAPEGSVKLDGFLGPAHVSTTIGSNAFKKFVKKYQKPVIVTGFEPIDILQAVIMLIKQINSGKYQVENQYSRGVRPEGNLIAQKALQEVFNLRENFEWRGLGIIPNSALKINKKYQAHDAEKHFQIKPIKVAENKGCLCSKILRGEKEPVDCKLFGKTCTPENPIGACMVSSEGTCAAYFNYSH
jgi:hydrogenase expression/formation protein HypD